MAIIDKNKFLYTLLFFMCFLQLSAQQVLVQNADLNIPIDGITTTTYSGANIYVEVSHSPNTRTGQIQLVLVDEEGHQIGILETIKFDEAGGKGFISNWEQFDEFQLLEASARAELNFIKSELIFWSKKLTEANHFAQTERITEIKERLSSLLVRQTEIREKDIFLPENRVHPNWVYTNTYERLVNEYMDGCQLNKTGLNIVSQWVIYRFDEENETTIRIGAVGDNFVEGTYTPYKKGGDYTQENDCFVLGEDKYMSIYSINSTTTYNVGRGECSGEINNNGDALKVIGKVLEATGVEQDKDGFYTITDDNFNITIRGSFVLNTKENGGFTKFSIVEAKGSK